MQGLETDLDSLRALKHRAEELASTHLGALGMFHLAEDPNPLARSSDEVVGIGGFANFMPDQDVPRDGTARASLASTARCVRSLRVSRDIRRGNADYTPFIETVSARYASQDLATYGLSHLNPFTIGQVLPVLREVAGSDPSEEVRELADAAATCLRDEVCRKGVSVAVSSEEPERRFPPHGYLTYWALVALAAWDELEPEKAANSLEWSETELYRQIALFATEDDERSDAYQLGYNLLVQHRFNRSDLGNSMIEVALRTLFSAQLERGVWEKRHPLFRYGDRGEAYCFSFELLATLLRQFRDEWEFLIPHESDLATALGWAERNALLQYGLPVWRSGHVIEEGRPESWATAEVYAFSQLYASYLSWRIESVVLEGFHGQPGRPPDAQAFQGLYQPEVMLPDPDGPVLLLDLLKERLVEPLRAPGERPVYSLVHHPDRSQLVRSGILFGPPGTGKTTYVRRVARYLGWPLVILDPSDFAVEGLHLVPSVAADVFSKLLELEDTVIFFDEMEPLMRRREEEGGFEQSFLTTSLIPQLQELADRAACLFFVATNRYQSIDPAARRPGRFDFRLQILPPAYEEKMRMAEKMLGGAFSDIEPELRDESHRKKLSLASRSEMLRLVQDMKRQPGDAGQVLAAFEAELADDPSIDEEAQYNSFESRT